jgi:hypothetical protein
MQGMNNIKNTKKSFFRPALSFHFSRLSESKNCSIAHNARASNSLTLNVIYRAPSLAHWNGNTFTFEGMVCQHRPTEQ